VVFELPTRVIPEVFSTLDSPPKHLAYVEHQQKSKKYVRSLQGLARTASPAKYCLVKINIVYVG